MGLETLGRAGQGGGSAPGDGGGPTSSIVVGILFTLRTVIVVDSISFLKNML